MLPLLSLIASAQEPAEVLPTCRPREWSGEFTDATEAIAESRPTEIADLEAWAFPALSAEDESERLGIRTEGLLIYQGGSLLYERYDRGYTAESPHLTWSGSKTFINALTAIAVRDGLLSIEDSICDHVTPTNPENCVVTVADLLSFSSGLQWRETYEGDPPTTSSVVSMLYGDGIVDMAAFISSAGRASEPGTTYQYSSGDTTLLAAVLRVVLEPRYGSDFAWSALFEPLGMEGVVWEKDGAGTLVGSSYLYAPPRSLARFGHLWLDDGCWMGERMLPEGWVETSTGVSAAIQETALDRTTGSQGWQVWLNQPVVAQGDTERPWATAPVTAYGAQGHWKQRIMMVPSHDMVIVRVGDDRDGTFDNDDLFRLALALGEPSMHDLPPPPPVVESPTGVMGESVPLEFDTGLLRIAANYGARLACSCLFVMEQDEAYCKTWVRASPDIVKLKINEAEKSVTARALGVVRAEVRWVDERSGCQFQ
ncbi:MAG: CubicO group peptidase (beta-lactamase class C family) [Myxococcota bacterium]